MVPPLFKKKYRASPGWLEENNTVYKLWLHPENIRYVKAQIIYALEDLEIENHIVSRILKNHPEKLKFIDTMMRTSTPTPNRDLNILQQLHNENVDIIFKTSELIYDEPAIINEEFDRIGEDGKPEYGEYSLTAYSFRGGQYHPEDIFMESSANRGRKYWNDLTIEIDPSKRGPANKWKDEVNPYSFNPYRVHGRHLAPMEPNCEDRRVNSVYKLPY